MLRIEPLPLPALVRAVVLLCSFALWSHSALALEARQVFLDVKVVSLAQRDVLELGLDFDVVHPGEPAGLDGIDLADPLQVQFRPPLDFVDADRGDWDRQDEPTPPVLDRPIDPDLFSGEPVPSAPPAIHDPEVDIVFVRGVIQLEVTPSIHREYIQLDLIPDAEREYGPWGFPLNLE